MTAITKTNQSINYTKWGSNPKWEDEWMIIKIFENHTQIEALNSTSNKIPSWGSKLPLNARSQFSQMNLKKKKRKQLIQAYKDVIFNDNIAYKPYWMKIDNP